MRDTIFKTNAEMPPKDVSTDVVRTAMTPGEILRAHTPAIIPNMDASVQNVERPRRGYGY